MQQIQNILIALCVCVRVGGVWVGSHVFPQKQTHNLFELGLNETWSLVLSSPGFQSNLLPRFQLSAFEDLM